MAIRINDYTALIKSFLDAGYHCSAFTKAPPRKQALILRHDIDFDLFPAQEMALIERDIGVFSTYFFMLRSLSYNLFEKKNAAIVNHIKDLGHDVSLHFDPTIYDDFVDGLNLELRMFESIFGVRPCCISIHRPTEFFLQYDSPIEDVRHTYQAIYQKQAAYFSDSQGTFRFGSPLASDAFFRRDSIHLLIHPIWWITEECCPVSILDKFLENWIIRAQNHIAENCKPYQSVMNKKNFPGC